jgi:hypothetical protein
MGRCVFVLSVVAVCLVSVAASAPTPTVIPPAVCLAVQLNGTSTADSDSSSSSSDALNSYGLSFIACTTADIQTVPPLPHSLAANTSSPPVWTTTLACAAQCGSTPGLLRLRDGGVQFSVYNGSCYCVNDTTPMMPTGGASETCLNAAVFRVTFACAFLNASLGCGPGCSEVNGCCSPDAQPNPNDLPSYYRTMIQWVAIVVIILALVEALVYGCLRRRAIQQRQRRLRAHMRPKRDAKEITERLLGTLAASPTAEQEPSIADEACSICLEPLLSEESLMLPCRHNIHRSCLRDFITHQLTRTNDVVCPMCRAPIVEEDEGSASDREGARAVRIAVAPE